MNEVSWPNLVDQFSLLTKMLTIKLCGKWCGNEMEMKWKSDLNQTKSIFFQMISNDVDVDDKKKFKKKKLLKLNGLNNY